MKSPKLWIIVGVLVVGGVLVAGSLGKLGPKFRQAEIVKGDIVSVVNATGTVQPVRSIRVGAVMPGKVKTVHVKHNQEVTKGQVLAEIDSDPNTDPAKVIAPADGIIIEQKVESGDMLGEHQKGELFILAPDLQKQVHVYASIDEADIGQVRNAQQKDQPVYFMVDAYTDEKFEGRVQEVRMSPKMKENVVTYHVVVAAANPSLKLLPGMTAKLSFQISKREGVLKIPSAALRFFPKLRMVHPDDRHLLEGEQEAAPSAADATADTRSVLQRVEDRQKEVKRHVWRQEGDVLRAVEVSTGLNDNLFTEMVSGPLQAGDKLVVGLK